MGKENNYLSDARKLKNDEFYTLWNDIEAELQCYDKKLFENKIVLLPCDDPYESNFFKYFALNFKNFKLKKLIATCYDGSPIANKELDLFTLLEQDLSLPKMRLRKNYRELHIR